MKHILSFYPKELEAILMSWGEKKYRIKQLLEWIYKKYVINPDMMSNLPISLRDKLKDEFTFTLPEIDLAIKSNDDSEKIRLKLHDGQMIEMVFMPNDKKNTLCISSQVGCARDCRFCATAKLKLIRNLEVEELIAQIYIANQRYPEHKLTNLVLMGMGEPLDNYENIIKFINIMQAEEAFSFSPRRMTLSTCGHVPHIKKLADSGIKIKLAVSLNSAINDKRDEIMPINKSYPLEELKSAVMYYRHKSPFRITFEYIMIKNFNMSDPDVKALIKFAGDVSCKINLIKWNKVPNLEWESPSEEDIKLFISKLSSISAAITLRQSRGDDISAACGQLVANKQ